MPTASRRYKRKSRKGLNALIWLIVLAIFAGGIVFLLRIITRIQKTGLKKQATPKNTANLSKNMRVNMGLKNRLSTPLSAQKADLTPMHSQMQEPAELCR